MLFGELLVARRRMADSTEGWAEADPQKHRDLGSACYPPLVAIDDSTAPDGQGILSPAGTSCQASEYPWEILVSGILPGECGLVTPSPSLKWPALAVSWE